MTTLEATSNTMTPARLNGLLSSLTDDLLREHCGVSVTLHYGGSAHGQEFIYNIGILANEGSTYLSPSNTILAHVAGSMSKSAMKEHLAAHPDLAAKLSIC